MGRRTVSMPGRSICTEQNDIHLLSEDLAELVETPECRTRSGRGVLTGVLLGAGLWAAILAATGVIKL